MEPLKRERPAKFSHGEAFKLMKYASKDNETIEWLWNSRDGVTPFSIPPGDDVCELDDFLRHVDWFEDIFAANFVPPVGMRVFVDHTLDSATASADRRIRHLCAGGEEFQYSDEQREALIQDILQSPRLVRVDSELHQHFHGLAAHAPMRPAGYKPIPSLAAQLPQAETEAKQKC